MQGLRYFLHCYFLIGIIAEKYIDVKLSDGSPVIGNLLRNGKAKIGEFLGIPYAEPPTNSLRFMRPVAKKPWSTALKCTSYRPACLQRPYASFKLNTNVSEDCLYLNIWAPQVQDKRRLPVIAFIHGGAFQLGAASMTNASLLAARNDVIVVLMNYRLAAFGFLTVSDTIAAGNMGLWDQTLSLEWIKVNIANFGGDPEMVAIFGQSAGGASVGFQVLSPKAANLFHAAVAQSGTPNAPWAMNSKTKADWLTNRLAEIIGCNNTEAAKLLECLQAVDGHTLINADQTEPFTTYIPVVDGQFLPDEPMKLAKSGNFNKVDLMMGYTANEGLMMAVMIWRDKMAEYSHNFSRSHFIASDAIWDEAVEAAWTWMMNGTNINAIKHEYSRRNEPITAKVRQDSLDTLLTDQMILCPMLEFAKYTARHASTYVYKFNGIGKVMFPYPDWMGSLHAADLEYLLVYLR